MDQKKEIKEAIETILGSKITLRDDGTDPVDELKENFIKVMDLYQGVWDRQNEFLDTHGMDFTSYDEAYFKTIEGIIHFCFEEIAASAILFYVYSRIDNEGTVHPFVDSNGEEHMFNTIDDLWEFLLYWAEEMMRP